MSQSRCDYKILILVPAYNEAERLPFFLKNYVSAALEASDLFYTSCMILDDGSKEAESELMRDAVIQSQKHLEGSKFSLSFRRFSENGGKGRVLRAGFLSALQSRNFDIVGFLDADAATHPAEGFRLVRELILNSNLDAVLGSRLKCLGYVVKRSLRRHVLGRIFATLVSSFFDIPIYDSQCGAKFFRTSILSEEMLNNCTNNRWLFDFQLVLLLWRKNHFIREFPIHWIDQGGSKISMVRDPISMFFQLWRMKKEMLPAPKKSVLKIF